MINIAIEAARKAGTYLKKNVGNIHSIERKGGQERDLVTEIDKGAEEIIIETIKKHFPQHGILGEESGTKYSADSEYKWVIDPLDGTTNFTHGLPVFCVSIGLERNGEVIAGVIFDPNMDEMFTAEKGKGAYLNGKKIHVSNVNGLNESLLVTGFPYNIAENPNLAIERFVSFLLHAQAVRRMGSAAIDLAYVAAGRYEGFWEVALNPWDVAAGSVILHEAGGMITDFSGKISGIYSKEVLASNGRIHKDMVTLFKKIQEHKIQFE
jgi:myo-inositol-1(or 4)-monophosphatase